MSIDSALRHVAHEVAPGNLLTVAFVLPSGQPCKLRAMVVHCDRQGCGVQFQQGPLPSLANLRFQLGSDKARSAQARFLIAPV